MFIPRILSRAPFSIAGIGVEIWPDEWAPTPAYESLVDIAWREKLSNAQHPVWDGMYYRVLNAHEWPIGVAVKTMRLGAIRYRYIATFPSLCEQHASSGLEPLNHLSTVAIIGTTDGHCLFGKRAWDGTIDLIGGGVQQDEIAVSSGIDLERNLLKEIREEAGIHQDDIAEIAGIGILLSATSNVLILGRVQTRLSRAGTVMRFAGREDNEMAEPIFVPDDKLRRFLKDMTDYRTLIPELL